MILSVLQIFSPIQAEYLVLYFFVLVLAQSVLRFVCSTDCNEEAAKVNVKSSAICTAPALRVPFFLSSYSSVELISF